MRPRVLLAVPAASYRAGAFVEAARRLGVELVLATDFPGALRHHGLDTHAVDFADPRGSAASLASLDAVDGVVAVDEKSAAVAAWFAVSPACRGRFHAVEGVLATRDKRRLRERLSAAGVNVPAHRVLAAGQAPATLCDPTRGDGVRFPCVVKAPMLSGSQGVLRADDPAGLVAAVSRVRRILERHPSPLAAEPGFFDLVVEDYVPGAEVAVEAMMQGGGFQPLAIFDKPDPLEGPTFEETLYVTPSRAPDSWQAELLATARRATEVLGLGDGPLHAELRGEPGARPVLIEIAARSIGGLCARALRHVLGSLEERLLEQALGRELRPLPAAPPASGVMMIPVPRSGVLRGVEGLEQARAIRGVDAVEVTVDNGETIRTLPEGDRYLGFIFAHGEHPAEVEAALRRAAGCLSFDLKPLLDLA